MTNRPEASRGSHEADTGQVNRNILRAAGGAALLAVGVVGGALLFGGSRAAPNTAVGFVSCTNSQDVEGVWVDDGSGDPGWATITPPGGVASTVTFSRPIRRNTYSMIGDCGGSPTHPGKVNYSEGPFVADVPVAIVCDGLSSSTSINQSALGVCRSAGVRVVEEATG
jgi:hypothetical protein